MINRAHAHLVALDDLVGQGQVALGNLVAFAGVNVIGDQVLHFFAGRS